MLGLVTQPACKNGVWRHDVEDQWALWVSRPDWRWRSTGRRQAAMPKTTRPKDRSTEWRQTHDDHWEQFEYVMAASEEWTTLSARRPTHCLCGLPLLEREDGSLAPSHPAWV